MHYRYLLIAVLTASLCLFCSKNEKAFDTQLEHFVPTDFSAHNLQFDKPVERWDEAIPLGNGMMGVLVWGGGQPLKLSLDRADLWDTRPVPEWQSPDYNYQTMRKWVAEGRIDDLHRLYEEPYRINAGPTKIPAGRIELTFSPTQQVAWSRLSLASAIATVNFNGKTCMRIFQHATEPVGFLLLEGAPVFPGIHLAAPSFGGEIDSAARVNSLAKDDLSRLGYPSPHEEKSENSHAFLQQGWGTFQFAVALVWETGADSSLRAAWSIATTNETDAPLDLAKERAKKALDKGFDKLCSSHEKWWSHFWNQARISVPNPVVERQWFLDTYKFGSAARRGAPPITLQAVWTADEGKIPPWKGDYHHDLNTQLSYWPCYSGNHLEEGLGYLDWLRQTLPEARKYTRAFFNMPGLNVPMTADIEGKQMGGWHQYTHSATISAWLAHHFYLHWRYSMDRDFLESKAYPYLKETAEFIEAITEKNEAGKRFLPLSSSPEIFDNRLEAWLPPTSNYDLALMRWLFSASAELAGELALEDEKQHWMDLLFELPEFSLSPDDSRLLVAPGLALHESHRHFSHLMAIHPLGLFRWEDGETDQRVIRQAMAELERLGTDYWTGYSFAWQASLAARAKQGERAENALEIFANAFCSQNSFHLNGDQTGSGYSKFTYRPFTLEGNMAAAAGVQEMLLQSYGGVIRIFPALPEAWQDAGFFQLRAQGAFLVSAKKREGQIERVAIFAETGGTLIVENNFNADQCKISLDNATPVPGNDALIKFDIQPGGRVVWTR